MFGRKPQQKEPQTLVTDAVVKVKDAFIVVVQGDITELESEAIVSGTTNHLAMNQGVAAAVASKGGRGVEEAVQKHGSLRAGETIITPGGGLKAKNIIHVVSMRIDNKTSAELIRSATAAALQCAQKNNFSTLAFPALGCDMGEFPYEIASKLMAQEIFKYFREPSEPSLKKIVFALYSEEVYDVFKKCVCEYLKHLGEKLGQGPFVTVDAVIEYNGGIVLIERSNPPLGWALPGGFVDYGESLEQAVAREVKEETGLEFTNIKQLKAYSAPGRDPRFHTVTVVFYGQGGGKLAADSDARNAQVLRPVDLPQEMAFDHRQIIQEYLELKCSGHSDKPPSV